jgi:long-chain acyl-CoA synthetase
MLTLGEALRATARHNATRTAIRDPARDFTWREFADRVARFATALGEAGIARGDRFGIVARNGFRTAEMMWGGYWSGIVPVPVNFRLAPAEIAAILDDAACRRVFVETPFLAMFEDPALAAWRERVVAFGDAAGEEAAAYEALIAGAAPAAPAATAPDDDAILLYTGGTTGRAKGVRLSHANIASNAVAFAAGVGARRDDVFLHVAPMFHSADLLATGWMLQGAAQAFLPAFSPAAFLASVARFGVTATVTVPTMLIALVSDPGLATANFASLRTLIYGAAPMAAEWIERVAKAFPAVDFLNCYGLTETAPDLTIFDPREFRAAIAEAAATGDRRGAITSVGKPNLLNQLKVVAPDGREVGPGEAGELLARGPNIATGYLNRPEETAAAFRNGWLHTGDIARIDAEGYVYLLDRLKDMVISGGENVYCGEVEAVLHRHPSIAEAAVIGAADARLGETVMAVVVLKPGAAADAAAIDAHCRRHLGGFKVPRRFAFVERLPRSALGKVLKGELRRGHGGAFGAGAAACEIRAPQGTSQGADE